MIPWMFKRASQSKAFAKALESLISGGEDIGMQLGKGLPRDSHMLAALAQKLMGKGLGPEDAREVLKLFKQVSNDDMATALRSAPDGAVDSAIGAQGGLIGLGKATPADVTGSGVTPIAEKMINSWTGRTGY